MASSRTNISISPVPITHLYCTEQSLKLIVAQLVKNLPFYSCNPKVRYRVHRSLSLDRILSQTNPVYKDCFNSLCVEELSLSLRLPDQNFVRMSHFSSALYMFFVSHHLFSVLIIFYYENVL